MRTKTIKHGRFTFRINGDSIFIHVHDEHDPEQFEILNLFIGDYSRSFTTWTRKDRPDFKITKA